MDSQKLDKSATNENRFAGKCQTGRENGSGIGNSPCLTALLLVVIGLTNSHTAVFAADSASGNRANDSHAIEYFEKHVRPLLASNCYNCHSASTKAAAGLRVDDHNGLLEGGRGGAAIVPGHPEQSLLIKAVKHENNKLQMPPGKQLPHEQIAILEKWIQDGAVWPATALPSDLGELDEYYADLKQDHWAWQPLKKAPVPEVSGDHWAQTAIDHFVKHRLEKAGLNPVADASRAVLIRRLSYDLTGLPPTPAEVEQFLADTSETAVEQLVDRLLSSPAFGERWGRHWLDVARYGESTGSSRNLPYPHAWRYRDYVIAAFNEDKPYHVFLTEQIAGDLLPAETAEERQNNLIATGFLALGVKDVNQRFKVRYEMDNIDELIDTVTRSTLALTVSCARCHDHKFDPVPTADYYALAGIFKSTDLYDGLRNQMGGSGLAYYVPSRLLLLDEQRELTPEQKEELTKLVAQVEEARLAFVAIRDGETELAPGENRNEKLQKARQKFRRLEAKLKSMNDPAAQGEVALGVRDAQQIADTQIRIRGEAELLGPIVPRGFLSTIELPETPQIPADQSGRLELARWLTSEHNSLAQRVVVNRIWSHLFGTGLVSTVDNFGINGDVPTHPELLDYLAERFVENGWSTKALIREIVLSRTYQLSTVSTTDHLQKDPANRLLWRHTPRRMAAEELRDSLLVISGQLTHQPQAGSPAQNLPVMEIRNNGPEARTIEQSVSANFHRSVYLPLLRGITPTVLQVFDFAEQGMVTGKRDVTTVAPQALFLLNDPLVCKQSLKLAENLLNQNHLTDAERISSVYLTLLSRRPTDEEIARAELYLKDYQQAFEAWLPTQKPETLYARAEGETVPSTSEQSTNQTAAPQTAPRQTPPDDLADPDSIDQSDSPVLTENVQINDGKTAAWTSFCQAMFSSAEFLYVE